MVEVIDGQDLWTVAGKERRERIARMLREYFDAANEEELWTGAVNMHIMD